MLTLISITGCSHKTYPEDMYQSAAVKADGDLSEWNRPLRFGSSSGLAQYNVTNDRDNLYISLETHDEATALKILRSGINIYLDPAAGKSKKKVLEFPLPNSSFHQASKSTGADVVRNSRGDMLHGLLVQAITFNTVGFSGMENKMYDVSDRSKIAVAVSAGSDRSLGYEAVIPLKYIFGSDADKMSGHNLSVGIVINAIKNEGEHTTNSGSSNRPSMGTGGRRGGGGGGGRMGGGGGGGGGNYRRNSGTAENNNSNTIATDRTALYKADTNWYTFKLSQH